MKVAQHLNSQLLKTFVTVADTGSLLNAARLVGRTEAAVSLQMRRLEEAVGDPPLFERHGRRKILTARGEMFLAHARAMLRVERSMIHMLSETERADPVRLGAPDDYSPLLPGIIAAFAASSPGVEIELHCQTSTTLNEMVGRGALDLAIVTRHPGDPRTEILRREDLVWVAARDGSALGRARVPLATFQPGCLTRHLAVEALTGAGRRFDIVLSSPSLAGVLQPVVSGTAVAAMSRCSVPANLCVLGAEQGFPPLPSLEIALARGDAGGLAGRIDALAEAIRGCLAASPREAAALA